MTWWQGLLCIVSGGVAGWALTIITWRIKQIDYELRYESLVGDYREVKRKLDSFMEKRDDICGGCTYEDEPITSELCGPCFRRPRVDNWTSIKENHNGDVAIKTVSA